MTLFEMTSLLTLLSRTTLPIHSHTEVGPAFGPVGPPDVYTKVLLLQERLSGRPPRLGFQLQPVLIKRTFMEKLGS